MLKNLVPIVLSLLLFILLLSMFWREAPGPQRTDQDMEVDLNIKDFTLTQGQEGRQLWELDASEAGFLRAENDFLLHEPVMTHFGNNGSEPVKIWAVHGRVDQDEQTIYMWEDVQAESQEMQTSANKATYKEGDRYILLEEDVVFTGRGLVVNTPMARILLDEDKILATNGVRTNIHKNSP